MQQIYMERGRPCTAPRHGEGAVHVQRLDMERGRPCPARRLPRRSLCRRRRGAACVSNPARTSRCDGRGPRRGAVRAAHRARAEPVQVLVDTGSRGAGQARLCSGAPLGLCLRQRSSRLSGRLSSTPWRWCSSISSVDPQPGSSQRSPRSADQQRLEPRHRPAVRPRRVPRRPARVHPAAAVEHGDVGAAGLAAAAGCSLHAPDCPARGEHRGNMSGVARVDQRRSPPPDSAC